jgi:nucleoside-diphosphate-sugar epimerase
MDRAKVFVTGANGLLATNTINELVANGYFVVALVRNKEKFLLNDKVNIEVVEGDITDYIKLEPLLRGCDYIIHTAAETSQGLSGYSEYTRVNSVGTENILKASIINKAKKFIHVSTSNVFGFGTIGCPGNEMTKISKPFSESLYVQSKVEAQELSLSYSDKLEVIVVNPTFLIGPYDQKPGSGRIIVLGYHKRVLFYPPGGKNFVDVRDAAKAIVHSLTKGSNQEKYLLSGENLSYKEFFAKLGKHSGTKPLLIGIPCFVLILTGLVGNFIRFLGYRTEASLTNMRILCEKNYYSNTKAENDFGIKFNSIDSAIDDAVNWFKMNGMIKN